MAARPAPLGAGLADAAAGVAQLLEQAVGLGPRLGRALRRRAAQGLAEAHEVAAEGLAPLDEYNAALLDAVHPVDWKDPTPEPGFVYDLIALGAGAGGLVSAKQSARRGAKSALISAHLAGGDCLNVGCVPSKCLVAAAKALQSCRKAASLGVVGAGDVSIDFPRVMKRMRDIRGGIAPHDGVARYGRDFCAAVIIGEAAFVSETEVIITARDGSNRTQTVAFDRCMVATGASAAVPPAPGLLETPHLTNGNFFNLEALPPTLGLILSLIHI